MDYKTAFMLLAEMAQDEYKQESNLYNKLDAGSSWQNYARAEYHRGAANACARFTREVARLQKMVTETARKQ